VSWRGVGGSIVSCFKKPALWWGLLCVLILGLIWLVAPGIAIFGFAPFASLWIRLLLTAVLVGAVVYLLWGKAAWAAHQAGADELQDEIKAELKAQRRSMRVQFALMITFLKRNRPDWRRAGAYHLPWYWVIGPKGAGKDAFLQSQRLDYAYVSRAQSDLKADTFDWWVSDEAMFLRVAGDLFDQASKKATVQWNTLIKWIKKLRPARAINGVILVLNLQELIEAEPDKKVNITQTVRDRVQSLQSKFGLRLPIYVFFTHADVVNGFHEYFDDLSDEARYQACGISFSAQLQGGQSVLRFTQEYDRLLQYLNTRVFNNLAVQSNANAALKVYQFPGQMAALRPLLDEYLKGMFVNRRFFSHVKLRGIYFVSGGAPQYLHDIILKRDNRDEAYLNLQLPRGKSSYFSDYPLRKVVLAEQECVGVNKRYEWRRKTGYRLRLGAIIMGATALATGWVGSFATHMHYLSKLDNATRAYAHSSAQDTKAHEQLTLLSNIKHLHSSISGAWLLSSGLYQSHGPYGYVQNFYHQALVTRFLPSVRTDLAAGLQVLLKQQAGSLSQVAHMKYVHKLYLWLSSYMMLSHPGQLHATHIESVLGRAWAQQYQGDRPKQDWLNAHLHDLLALPFKPAVLNQKLISQARKRLYEAPVYMRAYVRLRTHMLNRHMEPLALTATFDVSAAEVFSPTRKQSKVPQFFTKAGYERLFLENNIGYLRKTAGQQWVLGSQYHADYSVDDLNTFSAQLAFLYWEDYLKNWNHALSKLNIVTFHNLSDAMVALNVMTQKDSPLVHAMQLISRNTTFAHQYSGSAVPLWKRFSHKPQVDDNIVNNHFILLHSLAKSGKAGQKRMAGVLKALVGLSTYLNQIEDNPNPPKAAYTAAEAIFAGQPNAAIAALKAQAASAPQPLKKWLNQVVAQSVRAILAEARIHLNNLWQAKVMGFYQMNLAGRYPLDATAEQSASIDDFIHFFGARGLLSGFVTSQLKPFVVTDTDGTVQWLQISGVKLSDSPTFLGQIGTALSLQTKVFGGKDHMHLILTPQSLGGHALQFTMHFNGRQVSYANGPQIGSTVSWPAKKQGDVVLRFMGSKGEHCSTIYHGGWALFKMLAGAGHVLERAGQTDLKLSCKGMSVTYRLSSPTGNAQLNPAFLSHLHLPQDFTGD
jgi:type VI secretion system protein ImpL